MLQLDPPNAIILHVGVVQLRVLAAGKWTPDEPEPYIPSPSAPPPPLPGEPHLAYAQRYLQWSQPSLTNPQWLIWRARKVWSGQTVEELRDLIEADTSVDNECFLVNPQQPK